MADVQEPMLATSVAAAAERKAQLGQFFTLPAPSPGFVAGLFAAGTEDACRVLDAGAGMGALSDAFLRRWLVGGLGCQRMAVDALEIDAGLRRGGIEMVKLYMAFVALDAGRQSD